jgi:hypothetical protein
VPYVLGNIRKHSLERLWRNHCSGLSWECRGDCPMNIPVQREALRSHVARVAKEMNA